MLVLGRAIEEYGILPQNIICVRGRVRMTGNGLVMKNPVQISLSKRLFLNKFSKRYESNYIIMDYL